MKTAALILVCLAIGFYFLRKRGRATAAVNSAMDGVSTSKPADTVAYSWHVLRLTDLGARNDGNGDKWTVTVPDLYYRDRFQSGDRWQRNSDGKNFTRLGNQVFYISDNWANRNKRAYDTLTGNYVDSDWDYSKVMGDMINGVATEQWNNAPKQTAITTMGIAIRAAQDAADKATRDKWASDEAAAKVAAAQALKDKEAAMQTDLKNQKQAGNPNIVKVPGGKLADLSSSIAQSGSLNMKAMPGGMFSNFVGSPAASNFHNLKRAK